MPKIEITTKDAATDEDPFAIEFEIGITGIKDEAKALEMVGTVCTLILSEINPERVGKEWGGNL